MQVGRGVVGTAAVVVLMVIAGPLAGCGDDDGDSTAKETTRLSLASESPVTFTKRMAKLLATSKTSSDCIQLNPVILRSGLGIPCPASKEMRASMADFKVVGAEEYGTGAIVDYKSGRLKEGAAIVLFLGRDWGWGVSRFGVVVEPSTGTDDAGSRAGFDKTVAGYLDAVRERDCEKYMRLAFTDSSNPREVCKGPFKQTAAIARRMKADPSAKPSYEGGNSRFGFYTLETNKPKPLNLSIGVIKTLSGSSRPSVVLNVNPTATERSQRELRLRYEKAKRKGPQGPETSPSKKAD